MKQFVKILSVVFSLTIVFLGCAKKAASGSAMFEGRAPEAEAASEVSRDTASNDAEEMNYSENRKLVITADLSVRLTDLSDGEKALNSIIDKYNVYAESSNINKNFSVYTLKVPERQYKSCLSELKELGEILRCTEKTEDVTMNYYDLESRLNTKRELIKTYQSYLSRAVNIEELLKVERQIADLQSEIDRTGKEFRKLDNLVNYATIGLTLDTLESEDKSGANSFKGKFVNIFKGFGKYASTVALVLVWIAVYGVPSLLLLIGLYWVLFGKIGLLKKLWGKANITQNKDNKDKEMP